MEIEIDPNELETTFIDALQTHELGRHLMLHRVLDSSQVEARRWALAGASHGTLVWALSQTAGRGRLDRPWQSAAGAGLWFSIVLRPGVPSERLGFLSIVLGVGAARGLEASGVPARLKWPNDLLLGGRKLGGIIAEALTDRSGAVAVVAGIGINLEAPVVDGVATAGVGDVLASPPAAALLAQVLLGIEGAYTEWLADGPAAVREAWLELSDTIGHDVRLERRQGSEVGRAVDLADDGSLVIESADGTRSSWSAGDVIRLRPA